jgi:hypothetical protein
MVDVWKSQGPLHIAAVSLSRAGLIASLPGARSGRPQKVEAAEFVGHKFWRGGVVIGRAIFTLCLRRWRVLVMHWRRLISIGTVVTALPLE